MKYAVIGTGGIGGYYGSRLAQSGRDVHFLLHRDYAFVKEHGLQVDSCDGSFHLDRPAVYADALGTQTDMLLSNPHTRRLIREQMLEVIGAARHLGVERIDEGFADSMIEITDAMTPYSPSMKLDFDNRRPMEIEYLYTRPIGIAREAGFAMPRLEMLEAELRFLER